MRKFYPTPEERAEVVMQKLEHIIKSGKERIKKSTDGSSGIQLSKGISYKKWQDAAKVEIANAIRNAVLDEVKSNKMFQGFLMASGSCFATLGFLGIGVAWGDMPKVLVAVSSVAVGIILVAMAVVWLLSGSIGQIISDRRKARIARVNNLNEQLKKMESQLFARKVNLKTEIDHLKR